MWTVRNRHFAQPFFSADDGTPSGGGEGSQPETPPKPKPSKPEFSPEQQEVLNDLLARERKAAEERTALRLKEEADAKAKAEQEAREREEATKRGEFDKVRADLETKVSTVEDERDSAVAERDALRTYFEAEYTAAVKDLPDVITAFKPADDAPFAEKSAWLTKAREQAAKVDTSQTPGNRPNPSPANGEFNLQAAIAQARSTGKYRA